MNLLPKNRLATIAVLLFPLAFFLGCENTLTPEDTDTTNIIEGQYIVTLENQWDGEISEKVAVKVKQKIENILSDHKIHKESVLNRYFYALKGFAAILSDEQVESLENDPRIARVSPNGLLRIGI